MRQETKGWERLGDSQGSDFIVLGWKLAGEAPVARRSVRRKGSSPWIFSDRGGM